MLFSPKGSRALNRPIHQISHLVKSDGAALFLNVLSVSSTNPLWSELLKLAKNTASLRSALHRPFLLLTL